ncbi:MAG: MdtA/MuxA family multidrug efflux RND transporter periplasmic adaptor subunit [Bryobacteraceae bacterium]
MTPVESPPVTRTSPRRRKRWPWLLVIVLAAAAAWLVARTNWISAASNGAKSTAPGRGRGPGGAGRLVPVVASEVRLGDMPVYLDGLGSVSPFNTVTVRSRVDGELVNVAFQEGQFVKQGDLLAEIDPRPFNVQLELAEAQKAHDEALLANARLDLARYNTLVTQDAVPKQQLDTQIASVAQYVATVKADQAQIDNAKLQLVYSRITSPLTGRIGLRLVDRGNIVHATDVGGLAVVAELQPIAVLFNIAEDSLPLVSAKLRAGAKLPVIAWDRELKRKLGAGTVLTLDNQIDQTSGTVRFKAVFENADLSLFPNQFVNARLLIDTKRQTLIVPAAAIQRSPASSFVYRVKKDNSVEVRNVVTSITEGDEVAVDRGLEAGDVVVTDGIDKLEQGSKVVVRMAGAGSSGGRGAGQAAASGPGPGARAGRGAPAP